jgi:hypothetical protein
MKIIAQLILNLVFIFWLMPFWLIALGLTIHKIEDKNKLQEDKIFKNNKIFVNALLHCMIPILNIYFACIMIKTAIKQFIKLMRT